MRKLQETGCRSARIIRLSPVLIVLIGMLCLGMFRPVYADSGNMKVAVRSDQITITLSDIGDSGTAQVYAASANEYAEGDSIHGISTIRGNGDLIGTYSCGGSKTLTIDRYNEKSEDRLYDKYYVIQDKKILAGPVYATDIQSKKNRIRVETTSKKGILLEGDDPVTPAKDLGAQQAALNIDVTELLYANEDKNGKPVDEREHGGIAFRSNGKTYFFNKKRVDYYDKAISEATAAGINVTAIMVAMPNSDYSSHPVSLTYGDGALTPVMGFNTSNRKGLGYFEAVMEFLASRYSNTGHGVISSYVIGNEIDHPYNYWKVSKNTAKYKSGAWKGKWIEKRESLDTFMEEYTRALRIANLAVKKYAADAVVLVSLTHDWAYNEQSVRHNYSPLIRNSYAPKAVLSWIEKRESARGDYDWGVAQHNYSGSLPATDIGMVDTGADSTHPYFKITGDYNTSQFITVLNLEVLQKYLSQADMMYDGKPRGIYLTETGVSSGDCSEVGQKRQAAYIAQLYYRCANLDAVQALCYYRLVDHEAETKNNASFGLIDSNGDKKLAYDMYKHIDSKDSFVYSNPYLPYIAFMKDGKVHSVAKGNISSYKDAMAVTDGFDWDAAWNLKKIESAPLKSDRSDGTDYKYEPKYEYKYDKSTRRHDVIDKDTGKIIETEDCAFDSGNVTKQATRTKNGVLTYTCEICGGSYKETIPKLTTVSPVKDYIYEGVEIIPQIKVKDSNKKNVSRDQYLVTTLSGSVGIYTVKLDFNGRYKYRTSFKVTIHPEGTKLKKLKAGKKKVTVYWYAQPTQISGYQLQIAAKKSFRKAKTYTVKRKTGIKAGAKLSKTLKAKKGKYYVRVRTYKKVKGTKIYSSWSKAKSTKIR